MWLKPVLTILLFYFFALLQTSFFANFGFFGSLPNLVFILFFLLVFFEDKKSSHLILFYAVISGFFLDVFSATYFGYSIIALIIIGILFKKIQNMLSEKKNDKYPIVYFILLFLISFTVYDILLKFALTKFNWASFLSEISYNLLVAIIGFLIYKKYFLRDRNDNQLKLYAKI